MRNIIIGILCLIFFVLINGCSSNIDPQFRIRNEQVSKVSVSIQTTGSNKFNIDNIEPGQTTAYQKAFEGNITVTDIIKNESVSFLAAKNIRYTIVISTDKSPSMFVDK